MAQFAYRAKNRRGGMVSGVMSAATQDDLLAHLRGQGMTVLSIIQRSAGGGLASITVGKPRIKRSEIVYLATQLAVMIETGVPLPEALDAMVQQATNPTLREVLAKIACDVEEGATFSDALEEHPKHFNTMFVSLVRAGEASGNLAEMLTSVADYLVESQETRRKITGAMAYPAFMLSMAVIVVIVLLAFVLPRFTKIYENKGGTLPLPTRLLMGASGFCQAHWIPIVATLVVTVVGAIIFFRHPVGRRTADTLKLRLPIIGLVCRKYYITRSFRALGTMIGAGVPVISALEIARRTATNSHFAELFNRAIDRVTEGETLSDQFFATNLIPVTTAQMIFAGETSGRLGEVLGKVSSFCERDLKSAVKQMTNMMEPLLIGVMGFVVGGIAISLLLPMFTISKVLTK